MIIDILFFCSKIVFSSQCSLLFIGEELLIISFQPAAQDSSESLR